MVIKKELGKSGSTNWPRKGMYGSAWQAADGCGGDSDSPEVHYKDIMNSALGMADAKLAKILFLTSPNSLGNYIFKVLGRVISANRVGFLCRGVAALRS